MNHYLVLADDAGIPAEDVVLARRGTDAAEKFREKHPEWEINNIIKLSRETIGKVCSGHLTARELPDGVVIERTHKTVVYDVSIEDSTFAVKFENDKFSEVLFDMRFPYSLDEWRKLSLVYAFINRLDG